MKLIFDMGGTRTRFAAVESGQIKDVVRLPTATDAAGFAKLVGAMQDYMGDREVEAVIGGMPGDRVGDDGNLVVAHNLPGWQGLPILATLRSAFGSHIQVFNDVVLGGIGEATYGAGSVEGVMAYFTVSTGVNAVRIVDGDVDHTIARYEIGYAVMRDEGDRVHDMESYLGGAALERETGKPPRENTDPAIWAGRARALAVAVYNTSLYWAPSRVVFGGSMMRDISLSQVHQEMSKLPQALPELPKLVRAKLGDETGLHGALAVMNLHKK